jgi:hypothetical protein
MDFEELFEEKDYGTAGSKKNGQDNATAWNSFRDVYDASSDEEEHD